MFWKKKRGGGGNSQLFLCQKRSEIGNSPFFCNKNDQQFSEFPCLIYPEDQKAVNFVFFFWISNEKCGLKSFGIPMSSLGSEHLISGIAQQLWLHHRKLERIGDVTNWKRHQLLDEILIFLPALHRRNQQTCLKKKQKKQTKTKTKTKTKPVMQYTCET